MRKETIIIMTLTFILVPVPNMTITTSPISDGFYTGLNLTFTGKAEFHPNVDTPLHVSGTWFKMTDLRVNPRVRLEEPHLVLNGSRGTIVYES